MEDDSRVEKMVDLGGVRELVALGFSEDGGVQRSVVAAMQQLAQHEHHRITLILEA